MPMYEIKAKAEFTVVVEADTKEEAVAWSNEILPDIIIIDETYADRILLESKEVKVGKPKKVKEHV
jgi:DNA-binding NarL/FixJ family response regulator